MDLTNKQKNKIKWTLRLAFTSLGILIFALLVNEFREPLLGIQKGYASHNFSFNIMFYIPSLFISLGLSVVVIGRTIKHWRTWADLNKKLVLIGLSIPAIVFWTFLVVQIILID